MAIDKIKLLKRLKEIEEEENAKKEIYRNNPLLYFHERLGIDPRTIDWCLNPEYKKHKWDGTKNPFMQIINSLKEGKWVGVESATGTGKTFNGALIVLWFLECFENSIVVTTAPKQDQLALHIWKEISKLYPKFGKGELTSLKLRMNAKRENHLAVGFVAGIKANEESSTRAQGFHAENMLIIFEETPGIPKPVIAAFQNTCTSPNNLILAFGNPDHQLDTLHQFCTTENVEHIRISAYDHPNVVLNNPSFIPGAASKAGIERIKANYGEGSLYQSRVRGISPAQSSDSLILIQWCIDAKEKQEDKSGDYALGVDVANSINGDKAAIALGRGSSLLFVNDFQSPDCNQLGKRDVMQYISNYSIAHNKVGIDGVGVGAGTINSLKECGVKAVNLAGSASPVKNKKEEEFNNLRSQMYWQMREDLRLGLVKLPNDIELFSELTMPLWETRNGKIVIESKEEIKKRLGRSPNKADAAVYWNWIRQTKNKTKTITTTMY